MKQLSGADSMFLQFERGNNFMHVASLAVYDPSTAPGGGVRFKSVLRHFADRIAQFPQFRRRLVSLPLSLDRPYWVEADSIDVEFHVRHIALPHPGDWRQLCIQVARLHSRPLDRSKPLWEAYVIEGLHNVAGVPPGSFALYTKMHHAIVDGESGTEIMKALHSLTPEPVDFDEDAEPDARHVYHSDREPTLAELYSRALVHNVERLPSFARFSLGTARRIASLGAEAMTTIQRPGRPRLHRQRALAAHRRPRPPCCRACRRRRASAATFPRTGCSRSSSCRWPTSARCARSCRRRRSTTSSCASSAARCTPTCPSRNELPDSSMIAMVPMTLRGAEKGADVGNQVGFTVMPVHSEIEDPLERLRMICDAAQTAKRVTDAVGKEIARDLLETLPSIVADPLLRNVQVPRIGLIVSNVRGPDVPLYLAGAQLVNYLPISIALDGMGLNVTAFSYAGTMRLCAISCREMLPDPAFFAECLQSAFDRLQEAAAREAAFTVAEAVALPPAGSDGTRTLEGRVARKPARARQAGKAAKSSRRKPRKRAAP